MLHCFSSELYGEMERELLVIDGSLKNDNDKYSESLNCVGGFIRRLEAYVLEHGFENDAQEIDFFRWIYPRFCSWLTYQAELAAVVRNVPKHAPEVMVRDYYIRLPVLIGRL